MDLRSDKRQKTQKARGSSSTNRGEAQETRRREIESLPAFNEPQSPADTDRIMEEICEWENLKEAMWRELVVIREQLLSGTDQPQPVKRVEIPKPDGGVRKLGIPTALDRFVQQAVMQVLQKQWDRTFAIQSSIFLATPGSHQGCEVSPVSLARAVRSRKS